MKTVLKVIAWIVGIVVALIIIAAIVLPRVIDPNDYRDDIAAAVEAQTGREMAIEGDLALSVFPWLGVEIAGVRLANAPGFEEPLFARAEEAQVRVRLLPLLRRELQVDTLVLNGLQLNLARNADGVTNWDDLVPEPDPDEPPETEVERAIAALAIGGIRVADARISWDDAVTGQRIVISDLSLTTGAIDIDRLADPIPVRFAFQLAANEPELSGQITFAGRFGADLERQRYSVPEAELRTDLRTPLVPGGRLESRLSLRGVVDLEQETAALEQLELIAEGARFSASGSGSQILGEAAASGELEIRVQDADRLNQLLAALELPLRLERGAGAHTSFSLSLEEETLNLPDLRLTAAGIDASAPISGRAIATAPVIEGQLQLTVTDAGRLATALEPLPEETAGALTDARLTARFVFDSDADTAEMPEFALSTPDLRLTGRAEARDLTSEPAFSGRLQSSELVPRDLMERAGLDPVETADDGALTHAEFAFDFSGSSDAIDLTALRLVLDDSTLTGSASVDRFAAPQIRYDLTLDAINADRYLPPENDEPTPTPGPAAAAGALELPMELLRSLDIDGTLRIGGLEVLSVESSDIVIGLSAAEGLFRVTPLRANLYGGRYEGNLRFDAREDIPLFGINETLTNVQLEPLLEGLLGEAYVTGTGSLSATFTTAGLEVDQLIENLNGNGSFELRDGMVMGINVAGAIREGYARYRGRPVPEDEPQQTDFSALSGTVRAENGVLFNDDLSAASPLLRVTGEGNANLVAERIDYLLTVTIVGTLRGQAGEPLEELSGIPLPLSIRGPLLDPSIRVEVAAALEARAREALERERERAREALQREEERARERAEEALREEQRRLERELREQLRDRLRF